MEEEENLTELILKIKGWYDSKVEQLKMITESKEKMRIHLVNDNGETVELPEKDYKGFVGGIIVALETFGEFPVKIEITKGDEQAGSN